MKELIVSLLLWVNTHGFPECIGQPEINRTSSHHTQGNVAWYQDEMIDLSDRFDYDGLFEEPVGQRAKFARSILVHELVHFCQARREGLIRTQGERAWSTREDEAYELQTMFLREFGSGTVLTWRRDHEG